MEQLYQRAESMEQLYLVVMPERLWDKVSQALSTGENESASYEPEPYTQCNNDRHRVRH